MLEGISPPFSSGYVAYISYGKVKVVLRGCGVIVPTFLTSALNGDE
jgi:hypothetical protein